MAADRTLIYDIGHHKGEDTDFYLNLGYKVVAIEANPRLASASRDRFQNAMASKRLHLIEGAIAPKAFGNTVTFFDNELMSVWGTVDADWASRNKVLGYQSKPLTVDRVDIAQVFRDFGIPHYLKIDVEGADHLVLNELLPFSDRPQYISIESDKTDVGVLRDEFDLLVTLGYTKFKVVEQARIPGSIIETRALDGRLITYTFEPHASGAFGEDIPEPWLTLEEALREYKSIFRRYRFFGDNSVIAKLPGPARSIARRAYRIATGHRGKLPGWFDTHACL